MTEQEKESLYDALDNDEDLTDAERREIYFSEISEQEYQESLNNDEHEEF